MLNPAPRQHANVSAWVLAGGEGRRMGGVDKGLQPWRGQPLAQWVMRSLKPQVQSIGVCANRNLPRYEQLLFSACWSPHAVKAGDPSCASDSAIPVSYTHLTLPTKRIV